MNRRAYDDTVEELLPQSMKKDGDGLRIVWSDGAAAFVPFAVLRKACPCATCDDERKKPPNPFKMLSAREAAAGPPMPIAMRPVGRYAYQITWNDGHDTGIYPLTMLRDLGIQKDA